MIYLVHRTNNRENTVFRYIKDIEYELKKENIKCEVICTKSYFNNSNNLFLDLFFKNINYLYFLIFISWMSFIKFKSSDRILITSDPPFFYVILHFILMFKKIEVIIWWQDLFPETFTTKKPIVKLLNYFRKNVIIKCKNIFISPDQKDYISKMHNFKIDHIICSNWSLFSYNKGPSKRNDIIKFGYLGNISISHNIINLINRLKELDKKFEFFISYKKRYSKFFEKINTDNRFIKINYLDDLEFEKLIDSLDICIVSEKRFQNNYLFPSKAITYIYKSKFILYHGNLDSFLHKILKKYKKFFFLNSDDLISNEVFDNILKKYNEDIDTVYIDEFDKMVSLKKIVKYIFH